MTPQEQQLLSDLLRRISSTPAQQRDPEADAMIQQALGARPDALYMLTQMAVIHEIALKQAEQQIADLQQRAQPQRPSSFLGGPWGGQQSSPAPQPQTYAAAPSSSPGFLHSVLTTASGVLAGEMAFSALHSLFSGSGHAGNSFLSGAPATETNIVNNYYNDNSGSSTLADNNYDVTADAGDSDFSMDGTDFT